MLNSRRALAAAALLLTVLYLVTRSHEPPPPPPHRPVPMMVEDPIDVAQDHDAVLAAASPQRSLPLPTATDAGFRNYHGRPQAQKPIKDMTRMSIHEKLAYAYPYNVREKFPAYVWQTWRTTPNQGDFQFREQEASWTEQHPGFVHEVLTDDDADRLLGLFYASVPEVLDAYRSLPQPILKADFFRYLILYARGGIYSDIDTFAIRSALEWIPPPISRESVGLVIGIEADPDRPDWANWYSRRIQFCQWTIQSKPGHPALRDIIARITNAALSLKRGGKLDRLLDSKHVVELTGPAVWTDSVMDYLNDDRFFDKKGSKGSIDWRNFTGMEATKRVGDVVILPITSFSPGVEQMGAKGYDDPMAFVKHDFEGTWKPESERNIGKQQEQPA